MNSLRFAQSYFSKNVGGEGDQVYRPLGDHFTSSPLFVAFFHEKNYEFLLANIMNKVNEEVGINMQVPNKKKMLSVMTLLFRDSQVQFTGNTKSDLSWLNNSYFKIQTRKFIGDTVSYGNYYRDASTLPEPIAIPTQADGHARTQKSFKEFVVI